MSLIIKIDEIKTTEHLGKAIAYIMNEKKTNGLSHSNSGISPEQILETFFQTKDLYPSRGNRQAYHYKFSFSKDEHICAEDAFAFINEWVEEYLKDRYDFVFSVHQDREHMHMHLIFNSVCREGGKFRYEKGDWNKIIKPLTNRLARKYHTGNLKEKDKTLDYSSDYNKELNGMTWKERVQKDIQECITKSKSYEEFKSKMVKEFQYQLREGVSQEHGLYLALTPPQKAKAIRTYKLDAGYMPKDIEKAILSKNKDNIIEDNVSDFAWAMSRNYVFIPYCQLSEYQKAMVRQTMDAKRMYHRTGTSLQLHEQSVRAMRKMNTEIAQYGAVRKIHNNSLQIQKERMLRKEYQGKKEKLYDRAADGNDKKIIR